MSSIERLTREAEALEDEGRREQALDLWQDAEKSLRTALRLDDADAWTYDYLAHVLVAQGRLDEAANYLRRAAAANPEDQRPRRLLREMGFSTEAGDDG